MKKQGKASTVLVLSVMMIILVHANLSIAAQEENNNGTAYDFGLIEDKFDSDEFFPDAISSHFHGRVLAQVPTATRRTFIRSRPFSNVRRTGYRGYSPLSTKGGRGCKRASALPRATTPLPSPPPPTTTTASDHEPDSNVAVTVSDLFPPEPTTSPSFLPLRHSIGTSFGLPSIHFLGHILQHHPLEEGVVKGKS